MPRDLTRLSIKELAKYGHFEELCQRSTDGAEVDLAEIFERAVTDFRTVKRTSGHQKTLRWCIDQGLNFDSRAGWLNESVVCLAAAFGNNDIIASMAMKGIPENPFVRASVGDVEFLARYGARHELQNLKDENGFNLLFYCAQSGLGQRDLNTRVRVVEVCRMLLDRGVSPSCEVEYALPIFPAFLCASCGGNEDVMRLLLEHGGLTAERFHQVLEHTLEPHQRSGEPIYHIAELILEYGFDINQLRPDQGRTLLHGAANRGSRNAVRWLLQHGASPNSLDSGGRTPLHACAERNTGTTVIKLLIDAGAELNAVDSIGNTPLDDARKNKRVKVAAYLESVGGRSCRS